MMTTPLSRGLAAAALLAVMLTVPVQGADVPDCSIKWIPADAAFYSTSLHNRAQLEAIINSKAVGRLTELPAFKIFMQKMTKEMSGRGGPLEKYRAFTKNPENQQLVELVGDMVSHEFFFYGSSSFIDFLDLFSKITGATSSLAQLGNLQNGGVPDTKAQQRALLKVLAENPKLLNVPDLVIGFKLSDNARAQAQLKRLDTLIKGALAQNKQVKLTYKQMKIAGGDFYSLSVDARQIPWEQAKFEDLEETPGEFDKLKARLKELTFSVNLGVRENYLLLSLGSTSAGLEKLGKGPALSTREEFAPLGKYADKKIIAIDYISKALQMRTAYTKADIEKMFKQGKELLKQADLPAELSKTIAKDMDELAKDVERYITEPGAYMGFTMMTPRGQETFSYDWSEYPTLDGSKPLTLLQHLGGNPLLAAVGRTKYDPQNYALLVKWLKVGNRYFEDFAVPRMGDDEKANYEQFKKLAYPLLQRLDKATRTQILPALADGQSAVVLDAKWKSKAWSPFFAPQTEEDLPLPELALVWGVSDADLLKKGLDAYREIFNDASAALSNAAGGAFPDLKINQPETRKLKVGTMYYYPIPPLLDAQVMPNGGLSDKVAVFSFSEKHSERILTPTPLQVDGGPLAKPKQNLTGASYLNWAGLIDAVTPWVELAAKQIAREERLAQDEKGVAEVLRQVRVVLDVLKCVESASTASYFEGKALVTHTELRVRDR